MGGRSRGGLALATLIAAGSWGDAGAQTFRREEVVRGVTVLNRERRDFDPVGVRLGGFRLNGSLETGIGWDSNVFGRTSAVQSDGFASETGRVNLDSDWTRHALGLSAGIDSRQYFSRNALNWTDWNVGAFGRYDVSADSNVEARYRHLQEHLDVYSYDVQSSGLSQPVPYSSDEFSVGANTRLNRVGLGASGYYRTYRFEDLDTGGVRNQLSRNSFDNAVGAVSASYALAPGRNVIGVFRLQDISYTDTAFRGRDSVTWQALTGFQYDFDGVWQATIRVGWQQRDYRDPRLKNLEGPALEAQVVWAPTQLTAVSFNAIRQIEESIRQDAVSYIRTSLGTRVDHELRRNVIVGAEVRADRREYTRPNQSVTDAVLTLNARYMLNRTMSVLANYSYTNRIEHSGGVPSYDRNIVQVRLRFAL